MTKTIRTHEELLTALTERNAGFASSYDEITTEIERLSILIQLAEDWGLWANPEVFHAGQFQDGLRAVVVERKLKPVFTSQQEFNNPASR